MLCFSKPTCSRIVPILRLLHHSSISFGRNAYDVIGVSRNADATQIKKAYYEKAQFLHPDKSSDPAASEKFQELVIAYETLITDDKNSVKTDIDFNDKYRPHYYKTEKNRHNNDSANDYSFPNEETTNLARISRIFHGIAAMCLTGGILFGAYKGFKVSGSKHKSEEIEQTSLDDVSIMKQMSTTFSKSFFLFRRRTLAPISLASRMNSTASRGAKLFNTNTTPLFHDTTCNPRLMCYSLCNGNASLNRRFRHSKVDQKSKDTKEFRITDLSKEELVREREMLRDQFKENFMMILVTFSVVATFFGGAYVFYHWKGPEPVEKFMDIRKIRRAED